jgi:hypothetical protein
VRLYDEQRKEFLFVGTQSRDFVIRSRVVAARGGLKVPLARVANALPTEETEQTVDIEVSRGASGYCFTSDNRSRCGFGPGIAAGWAFFIDSDRMPPLLTTLFNLGWLALLHFVVGFCTHHRPTSYAFVALLGLALIALPRIYGLPPIPRILAIGAVMGFCAGLYSRLWLQREAR